MSDPSKQRQIAPINLGIVTDLIRQVRLAWRLMFDSRVPLWVKTIVPASLVYLISPVDFVPDVIPGLGQLDDLAVIVIGVKLFIELCPPADRSRAHAGIAGRIQLARGAERANGPASSANR